MKSAGFLVGAGLAALAVWLFYALTTVRDDDLLAAVLGDHCLPYVQSGAAPFADMGRAPGVYDAVETREGLSDGGTRLLYDARFVAQWGIYDGLRFCEVKPTYASASPTVFEVAPSGFIARYTELIAPFAPLVPDVETLRDGPRSIGWYGADRAPTEGLRVLMVASPGRVASVLAVAPAPD